MNLVVVEAADAGGLGSEPPLLPDRALGQSRRFPRTYGSTSLGRLPREAFVKGYEHPSREDSVRRDILTAAHSAGNRPFITH